MANSLTLTLLPERLAVCLLPANSVLPGWAQTGELSAFIRTPEELSIVCEEKAVPEGVTNFHPWRALKVQGPLDFSLVGVLASLVSPLAEARVSIFALSTYQTDYLLVQESDLDCALETLHQAGHLITDEAR